MALDEEVLGEGAGKSGGEVVRIQDTFAMMGQDFMSKVMDVLEGVLLKVSG